MNEKIDQAINNLQAIANLAIDDDAIAEIATATVALLGEYAAQQSVQATGVDAAHTCPIHPIVFDVDGCFMCNPRA